MNKDEIQRKISEIELSMNASNFWSDKDEAQKTISEYQDLKDELEGVRKYDKSDAVTWIGRGGTAPMNDFQYLTVAKYDWRYLVGSIVRFGVDDQQNRGKNEIIILMNSKSVKILWNDHINYSAINWKIKV